MDVLKKVLVITVKALQATAFMFLPATMETRVDHEAT